MPLIRYPASLPCPSTAAVQFADRRLLSSLPGPRGARALSTDRLGTQSLEFFLRTRVEAQAWVTWLRNDIADGAAWFVADWPLPQGGAAVRRFVGAPSYPQYLPKRGGWVVSAVCQVRGRGALPGQSVPFEALLYASFNDGTPRDLANNPAGFTTSGGGAIFSNNVFNSTSGSGSDYSSVVWTGSKLSQLTNSPWTAECDVAWQILPNASFSRIIGIAGIDGSSSFVHEVGFTGTSGLIRYRYNGNDRATVAGPSSGTGRTHIALVAYFGSTGALYVGGQRLWQGDLTLISSSLFTISTGRPTFQGLCNYSVDNLRIRLRAVYSGPQITPPGY